jgi:hypothetical protein
MRASIPLLAVALAASATACRQTVSFQSEVDRVPIVAPCGRVPRVIATVPGAQAARLAFVEDAAGSLRPVFAILARATEIFLVTHEGTETLVRSLDPVVGFDFDARDGTVAWASQPRGASLGTVHLSSRSTGEIVLAADRLEPGPVQLLDHHVRWAERARGAGGDTYAVLGIAWRSGDPAPRTLSWGLNVEGLPRSDSRVLSLWNDTARVAIGTDEALVALPRWPLERGELLVGREEGLIASSADAFVTRRRAVAGGVDVPAAMEATAIVRAGAHAVWLSRDGREMHATLLRSGQATTLLYRASEPVWSLGGDGCCAYAFEADTIRSVALPAPSRECVLHGSDAGGGR